MTSTTSSKSTTARPRPKLIVFDLDYTLWPFWVDTHVTPPFRRKHDVVRDRDDRIVNFYPEVPQVLAWLHGEGYTLGVASRTSEIRGANQLMKLFDWEKYFKYKEIYPGCKVAHFKKFKQHSGLDYSEMMFFDDEHRNIWDLKKLGVASFLVQRDEGVMRKIVEYGLDRFAKERSEGA